MQMENIYSLPGSWFPQHEDQFGIWSEMFDIVAIGIPSLTPIIHILRKVIPEIKPTGSNTGISYVKLLLIR